MSLEQLSRLDTAGHAAPTPAPGSRPAHRGSRLEGDSQRTRTSAALILVYVFWLLMLWEVELFLSAAIGGPFFRIPTLLAPILILIALSRGTRKMVYLPLIIFVAMHIAASLVAENAGRSRLTTRYMIYVLILFASSVAVLDSPRKVSVVLKVYLLSFAWFGLQGLPRGLVSWHPLLANEDSFGPLMLVGLPFAYFYAFATSSTRWRWIARGVFILGIVGLVASFARGAVLSAAVVLLYILLKSPQKSRALIFLFLAAIVALPLMTMLVPVDAFLKEVGTSGEGDPTRMNLWQLAWAVFKTSPLVGVGSFNYGVVADRIASPDMREFIWNGLYTKTPHNATLQILAEEGLLGIALWFTMIVNFFLWNARLRGRGVQDRWRLRGGEELDLRILSYGLDGAMIAFLLTSIFYNQLYIHWFWSLLTISFLLHNLTKGLQGHPETMEHGGRISRPRRARA